jgi:hypothetical protein
VTVAAQQLELAAVDDRQQPVPVVRDLVQPAVAVRGAMQGETIWRLTR